MSRNDKIGTEAEVTQPTNQVDINVSSLVEEMRKTGTMTNVEKAERLEEIVQEAA